MPRLIGKKYNPLPPIAVSFLMGMLVGGGLVLAEYSGSIDYVPNFGTAQPNSPMPDRSLSPSETSLAIPQGPIQ
ncbi:hypothetical protein [Lyngbya confervoides]|uniref:Uncharacterized protein n=1 Tax=Lyngbya confervoides BDU141951 TaxID=1574623 RepID=A0ABD4SZT2_9CYAN|nr:hypothetical protein [Lyngbya confervoides]MCM1981567.1 hypothetical protein [Lyngbya confervoides BDU141951]